MLKKKFIKVINKINFINKNKIINFLKKKLSNKYS